ncbi:hypothetical protein [Mesorhizobium australafricanum]|uniref:Uncharacterized protein n=1 Tax=Mesorhizobium australafricanum TaxID=3072311 RepID=A0ABU4WV00_9HYPH|nr:hypothetical protein [Mesorhizobium sp. VK3E]MDX8439873.1 hypothetical protein [Mesorhizobium sp. VK3E]
MMLALGVPAILASVAFAAHVSTLMRAESDLQNALDFRAAAVEIA